jgi:hypothetical protein
LDNVQNVQTLGKKIFVGGAGVPRFSFSVDALDIFIGILRIFRPSTKIEKKYNFLLTFGGLGP